MTTQRRHANQPVGISEDEIVVRVGRVVFQAHGQTATQTARYRNRPQHDISRKDVTLVKEHCFNPTPSPTARTTTWRRTHVPFEEANEVELAAVAGGLEATATRLLQVLGAGTEEDEDGLAV